MRTVYAILLCLSCISLFGLNSPQWSKGSIVLNGGIVQAGEISIQGRELILFRVNGQTSVYGPHQAEAFYYYDSKNNTNRKFFATKSPVGYHKTFYEIVVWGEVQVVRELKFNLVPERELSDKYDFDYFVLVDNSMVRLNQFPRHVYRQLVSKTPQLADQVKKSGLNPYDEADAILIVKLFNQIFRPLPNHIASTK